MIAILFAIVALSTPPAPADPPAPGPKFWETSLVGASPRAVLALIPGAAERPVGDPKRYPGQSAIEVESLRFSDLAFSGSFYFLKGRLILATYSSREMVTGETEANIARVQTLVRAMEASRGEGRCFDGRQGVQKDGKADTSLRDAGYILYLCSWRRGATALKVEYIEKPGPSRPYLGVKLSDEKADWTRYMVGMLSKPDTPSSEP